MAQTKATKKFEQRHLKDALDRRNNLKKTKQKQKQKQKQKARRAEENGQPDHGDVQLARQKQNSAEVLQSMSVDDFFQGGFDVPEELGTASNAKAHARSESEADEELSSDDDLDEEVYQKQLNALAEKDPEFHKHLKEHEPELLDTHFDEEDLVLSGDESGTGSDSDADEPRRKRQKLSDEEEENDEDDGNNSNLSAQTVDKWTTAMQQQSSLRAAREVVTAFRAAVQSEDDNRPFKYTISDADVYHKLLSSALRNVPAVLQHHVPVQEVRGKPRVSTEGKFKNIAPLLKTHTLSIIRLLDSLSDAATLKLTLSSILPLLPYLLSFKKLIRDLCKAVVSIWASPHSEPTRIASFLVLRKLMTIGDAGIRESLLKSAYQALVQASRSTTAHTMAGINIMKNTAAELWGIDTSVGYVTGFNFIRQLAVHLRNSITNKTKDSYKLIYNWQYTHSLDFWSRVLAMHCIEPEATLRPLIYPLVQVTLGALRLIPTATYFPLRFQLTRALLRISASTHTYIPLAASLYEVLNSAELRKSPKSSTLKPLDFTTSIRAPKSYLRTRVYQDGVGEQVQELFAEFYGLWAKNIAFPELSIAVVVMLKRWLKDANDRGKGNKNAKVNGLISLLVQKVEANAKFIEEKRASIDYAPNNRKAVDAFLQDFDSEKTPIGAFLKGIRRQRQDKIKMIEESRLQEEQKYAKENARSDDHGLNETSSNDGDGIRSEDDVE